MEYPKTRAEAKAVGSKVYWPETPCPRGHIGRYYVAGGSCGQCKAEYAKTRVRAPIDPVKNAVYQAKWNDSTKGYQAKMRWKARDPKNAWACSAAGGARARAKKFDVPCDIDKEYIRSILTDACPVFGVAFVWYGKKLNSFSPSLDRIRPELGYVRGNVVVISQRANMIKSDASAEEIAKVLAWLQTSINP